MINMVEADTRKNEDLEKEEVLREDEKAPEIPVVPPLVVAARRLERLLRGGDSDIYRLLHSYTSPAKV